MTVSRASVVCINTQYTRRGDISVAELFKIEDMTEMVRERQVAVAEEIDRQRTHAEREMNRRPLISVLSATILTHAISRGIAGLTSLAPPCSITMTGESRMALACTGRAL